MNMVTEHAQPSILSTLLHNDPSVRVASQNPYVQVLFVFPLINLYLLLFVYFMFCMCAFPRFEFQDVEKKGLSFLHTPVGKRSLLKNVV